MLCILHITEKKYLHSHHGDMKGETAHLPILPLTISWEVSRGPLRTSVQRECWSRINKCSLLNSLILTAASCYGCTTSVKACSIHNWIKRGDFDIQIHMHPYSKINNTNTYCKIYVPIITAFMIFKLFFCSSIKILVSHP